MEDLEMLGRNVRRIRGERQLSLGALAQKSGLAKQTLANLEGGGGNPTVDTLLRVARALGVGVNWLVTEWGSPVLIQRRKDGIWDPAGSGRRRILDHIHGSGDVNTAIVELTDARDVAPPLSPAPSTTSTSSRGASSPAQPKTPAVSTAETSSASPRT
ncbi:helix-turn-helix transcriptional regulator [Blastococcus brunescens]|uniref:Helix-turn-helix transcriptional regulator n=1 Tax=Blastococcus brunescens TaxID=1564165 RepID=A0ABZ1B6Y7_9ACTN|nr:helix-turn-helix transcriptional regulator [Blastococcus sp. BMG 8361]WRL66551.1 helix-turn-helix transcriptional regulator [Blastococcus sp. BMG 8361]